MTQTIKDSEIIKQNEIEVERRTSKTISDYINSLGIQVNHTRLREQLDYIYENF